MKNKTVMENIYENYNQFFSAERKVADYVIKNPIDTVECTVAELAERSNVSDATVVRMCKHLGYKGYYQFRIMLAREVEKVDRSKVQEPADDCMPDNIFKGYANAMLKIMNNIDRASMCASVELLAACNWVHVIATGTSSLLAQYMGFRLGRLGVKCTSHVAPDYYMNYINLASENDIVIAITRSGCSKVVIDGIRLAKEKGLKVITITGYYKSEAARLSDYVLLSNANENKFDYFRSHAHLHETAVIDALLTLFSDQNKIDEIYSERPEIIMSDTKL